VIDVIFRVSRSVGFEGMCAGQSVDLISEGKDISLDDLKYIHRNKTGELISASVYSGARLAAASKEKTEALESYSAHLGLAFQIKDDILDLSGTLEEIGKPPGSDTKKGKATYPALLGIERAKELLQEEKMKALSSLDIFGPAGDDLKELAQYIVDRRN
jgi:geranylgeranyl diphosphate synthase type II